MKKFKNKIFIVLVTLVATFIFIPSISNAAASSSVLSITYDDYYEEYEYDNTTDIYWGDEDDPLIFDMKYDEIIINYGAGGKMPNSFFYVFNSDNASHKYGKYMITVIEEEKKVVFKRLGTTNILGAYSATPVKKTDGIHYMQTGAVYNDASTSMGFNSPLYKINMHFKFEYGSNGKCYGKYTGQLGNSSIQAGTVSSNAASHPQVYVFSDQNLKEAEQIMFSAEQIGNAHIDIKHGYQGLWISWENERCEVVGTHHMKNDNEDFLENNGKSEVMYEFVGLTSEILNDNENGTIEKIIAVVAISVGDLFRGVLNLVGGKNLTIDALIFNQYQKTILDFWGDGTTGIYTTVFQTVVNSWYQAFSAWTKVILVIVLVAMGIKAMILSGTSKQNKINNMFVGWFLAVVLLFFGPYFMKYSVTVNDVLVKIFRNNSEYSIFSVYNTDFVERYGISGDIYQYGEDSTTKSIKEQLMQMKDIIAEQEQTSKERWEKLSAQLQSLKGFFNSMDVLVKGKVVDAHGVKRTFRGALTEVEAIVLAMPNPTEDDVLAVINEIVYDIEIPASSNFIIRLLGNVTGSTLKNQLTQYALAYAEFKDLEHASNDLDKAIDIASKGIDLEGTMRERAGETKRMTYVAVWYVMMYQLLLLLFVYYKRLIVTGVLITIFPLVVMMYAIEKLMGISKSQTFGTWVKEFLVNVFIQSVHAFLYVMLVEAGLRIYEADADNWLLFLFAVMAIFPMESVVKSIIGMKSSTVSDLKKSAAQGGKYALTAYAATKVMTGTKGIDSKYDQKDAKAAEKEKKQDEKSEKKFKKQENKIKKDMVRGGDHEDAQERLRQLREKQEKQAEQRAKKRKASQRVRNIRRKTEKVLQPLRNAAALSSVITTGLAGGGDIGDFAAGMAVANVISGKNRKVTGVKSDSKSSSASKSGSKAPTGQDRNRYANNNGQGRAPAQSTSNRAADQARQETGAIDYGNGRTTPTAKEAKAGAVAQKIQAGLEDKNRQTIAARQQASVNQDIFYGENNQD